ncbi:MAG: GNAT family N-acetyltransferase [Legionellales bacterium]|nr:GNAT family N-acetyltransferase [Legionellales bacterium]
MIIKEAIWTELGFGPWAYVTEDQFIGWGGIQPDGDDFELALVLNPTYWGYGKVIYDDLIRFAFEELKLSSLVIYFPPSRTRIQAILKAGFVKEGEAEFSGCRFIRYRLHKPQKATSKTK